MHSKSILITGTSTGIGFATATLLAQKGFMVFAGVRKLADGDDLMQLGNGRIIPVLLDVTKPDTIETCLQFISDKCGENGLFALINNAGINYVAPFEYCKEFQYRELMEVNFFGLCKVTQMSLPLLKQSAARHKDARIINISSIGGLQGVPWVSFYAASKFALMGLTESIRYELKKFNIQVSVIIPGAVKTKNNDKTEQSAQYAISHLKPEHISCYQKGLELMKTTGKRAEKFASAPQDIAQTVFKVLGSEKPKYKYAVGGAKMMSVLIRILPTDLRQRMMAKQLGA